MYPWVTHTHTHLGGECPHQCKYCYVQRNPYGVSPRYKGKPRLLEEELKVNYGSGKIIFIEHMNDMWAWGIINEWIGKILNHCREYPENQYVFQTKCPAKIFFWFNWLPDKSLIGTTIETNRETHKISKAPPPQLRYYAMQELRNEGFDLFVTVEPILDFDEDLVDWIIDLKPSFVNIGADSKGCGLPEPPAWKIAELIRRLEEAKIPIKKKSNLKRLGF